MFALAVSCFSFTVGCGDGGNTVIEQEASETELEQEMDDYEKEMEEGAKESVE
jgi:hypothetical protein